MVLEKKCSCCGIVKPFEVFNKNSRTKDGRVAACKQCKTQYRENNKEKIAAQKRAWYDANREHALATNKRCKLESPEKYKKIDSEKYKRNRNKVLERVSKYQKDNPEVNRRASKKYRDANPHKGAAKAAKRRAKLKQATPSWALADEWEQFFTQEIYHISCLRSEMLGKEHHVDHAVPLTSKLVCGLHVSANLRVILAEENIVKHNRYWPDMWVDDKQQIAI